MSMSLIGGILRGRKFISGNSPSVYFGLYWLSRACTLYQSHRESDRVKEGNNGYLAERKICMKEEKLSLKLCISHRSLGAFVYARARCGFCRWGWRWTNLLGLFVWKGLVVFSIYVLKRLPLSVSRDVWVKLRLSEYRTFVTNHLAKWTGVWHALIVLSGRPARPGLATMSGAVNSIWQSPCPEFIVDYRARQTITLGEYCRYGGEKNGLSTSLRKERKSLQDKVLTFIRITILKWQGVGVYFWNISENSKFTLKFKNESAYTILWK